MNLFNVNDPLEALRALEVVKSTVNISGGQEVDFSFITPNLIGTACLYFYYYIIIFTFNMFLSVCYCINKYSRWKSGR